MSPPRFVPERVKIVDVAQAAGVSVGTASKALNGRGSLRPETREKVRRAADRLGFVPDSRGRGLSSGRTYTVGFLTDDSFGRFTLPILMGAEDALSVGQMAVVLCDTRDDPVREAHLLRSLASRGVDGLIVTSRRTGTRPPVDIGVPVVHAFTSSADPSDPAVLSDQAGGARAVVEHLRSTGRRRIVHVTGPEGHFSATERASAVLEAAGPDLAHPPLFGTWSEEWGRRSVDLVRAQQLEADAFCCGSDQIARGVVDRLRELGVQVPTEVAVTGFDDWEVMALASRPPLTTVDLCLGEVGRFAGRTLLDVISGQEAPALQEVAPQLRVRGSSV